MVQARRGQGLWSSLENPVVAVFIREQWRPQAACHSGDCMNDVPVPVVVSYEQFLQYRERCLNRRKRLEDSALEPLDVEPTQPAVLESIALPPRP